MVSTVPGCFSGSETPVVCHLCNKPIWCTIFNFNKIVGVNSGAADSWGCQGSNCLCPPAGVWSRVV